MEMVEEWENESMIVKIEGVGERAYCFTNNLKFALFSVNCLLQVRWGEIEMIVRCHIPKSFGEIKKFHEICLHGIIHLYHQFMKDFNSIAVLSTNVDERVQWREIKLVYLYCLHLTLMEH